MFGKRLLSLVCTSVVLLLVLSACGSAASGGNAPASKSDAGSGGGSGSGASNGSTGSSKVKKKHITLTLWTHDHNYASFFTKEEKKWAPKYPQYDITFKTQVFPGSGSTFWNKELSTMVSGQKLPDLMDFEISNFSMFMKPNVLPKYVMDLSGLIDENQFVKLAPYMYKGKLYALESGLSQNGYYYQSAIFKKYNIPTPIKSWDEFFKDGQILAKHGIAMAPVVLDGGANLFQNLLYEAGGQVYDKNGKLTVDSPKTQAVLNYIHDGIKAGIFKTVSSGDFWGAAIYQLYQQGKIVGVVAPTWYNSYVLAPSAPKMAGKWRIMPMPGWKDSRYSASTWGGTGIGVAKNSPNAKLAADLLVYAYGTKQGQIDRYKDIAYFPNMKEVIKDPVVSHLTSAYFGGQNIGKVWAEAGKNVAPFYQSPDISEFNKHLGDALTSIYTNKATPKDAIASLVKQMKQVSNGY